MKNGDPQQADLQFSSLYRTETDKYCRLSTTILKSTVVALSEGDWEGGIACVDRAHVNLARGESSARSRLLLRVARHGALHALASACGRPAEEAAHGTDYLLGIEELVLRSSGLGSLAWFGMFAVALCCCLTARRRTHADLPAFVTSLCPDPSICSEGSQHPTLALLRQDGLKAPKFEEDLYTLQMSLEEVLPREFDSWAFIEECLVVHSVLAGIAAVGSCVRKASPEEGLCLLGYVRHHSFVFDKMMRLCQRLCDSDLFDVPYGKEFSWWCRKDCHVSLESIGCFLRSASSLDVDGIRRGAQALVRTCAYLVRVGAI